MQVALQAYSARGGSFTADEALTRRQKALTSKLDDVSWARQLAAAPLTAQALLRSEAEPGARAFLVAVPHGATRMDPATFTCELRYRLGVPDALNDSWCPKCDAVLDTFSHHAGICAAGGERTLRHHSARDVLHTWPSVLDCSQRKSAVACCSLTALMGQAEDGGPLTFLFLPT